MQNSDTENEYVKSMLSKQKSYIPRFALLLNALFSYDGKSDFNMVEDWILIHAEKLSDYFINMSKKIKVSMLETVELKTIVSSMKGQDNAEIIQAIFKAIPDANKSEVAELLHVSRKTVYKHLKKC
jgi:DNA-binding NtrC family response regulator